ncbi:DUF4250 domain-containing protein [Anaerocolumna sedimenticola]|uniref:DUF4250 domain-containing protein n=1 Tax=Anaerocolumna sedimenticola TaxID=2696063 RepID=A0A6P1TGI5_9FIRM|nr:DUF4250 domain-containing protein [Anaerocolumna sedimenticola]QHQ59533.1 DUF4250 domain-containing protein [Anaerocolumna sedimenticola]
MPIPQDPIILLSYINTQLRDYYNNLTELCLNLNIEESQIVEKLKSIQYEYDPTLNQFK